MVGYHPILMEQNLRKILCEIKVVVFPMFFIQLCCGIQPYHYTKKPHETPRNPNIVIDKPPKISDWEPTAYS